MHNGVTIRSRRFHKEKTRCVPDAAAALTKHVERHSCWHSHNKLPGIL